MSWLYSRALVAAYSEATSSDGARSALSSLSPTPQAFLPQDKMTAFSRPSRFGMTFAPLTDALGKDLLTWFLADSRVRTYQLLAEAKESADQDQDFGLSSLESLARFDLDTSTWRTPQFSLLGDWDLYSEIWPRSGLMRGGECWEQPMLELRTSETGSGLWPTPNVPNGGRSVAHVTEWSESGRTAYHKGKKVQVGLESAVKLWPTPKASTGGQEPQGKTGRKLVTQVGGQLNPTWVEWLMGWPQGWTDLKPLETGRFREWQRQHSMS